MSVLVFAGFLAIGATAGVLAGLLGVGGGLIIVPALVALFEINQIGTSHVLQIALGTSLASIVFTSISSLRAHHGRGAVQWSTVRGMAGGLVLGTFAGSWLAARLPSIGLKWFFVVFAYLVAAQMLFGYKPKPTRQLPGSAGLSGVGGLIGGISSFVGIGGGSLSVPFMSWCNVPMQMAVGTSAALGLPIAVAGLAGYALNGIGVPGLPSGSMGFVYLPALLGIALASVVTAPFGAALAHRLPVATLKKCFAALLLLIASRMLFGLLSL
ncbi:sulfite exporter TauE/SafE family protein [Chitinimonas arctica]|uniref:Probable membrane transporter protein n=1 Tax=Chitinimonas arctica TaxID=2594795 RepID=A0A516SFS4_9NEIS|nr:sulfite exporter TauE/SafE family protein [Chitinimonas arctica]QDQ26940.1 sulfite exporter TauE/SafE family protein [Chitinimonas arctica]